MLGNYASYPVAAVGSNHHKFSGPGDVAHQLFVFRASASDNVIHRLCLFRALQVVEVPDLFASYNDYKR